MAANKLRLYRVVIDGKEYLVRANGPSVAARYALISLGAQSELAKQDDIVRLVGANTTIIEAPDNPQADLLEHEPVTVPRTAPAGVPVVS